MKKKQKKFLNQLLENPLFQYLNSNASLIQDALEKDCADTDTTEIVVDDYFHLLKHVHRGQKPSCVALDPKDLCIIIADGICYDLDALIRHSDTVNTERKMEIEALLGDGVSVKAVQTQLNQKINENW